MFEEIADEIANAKANRSKAVMVHFQVLTNADRLQNIDPEHFCDEVGIESSWAVEFRKMINLAKMMSERGYAVTKK